MHVGEEAKTIPNNSWRVEMFGALRVHSHNETILHFRTKRAALLLTLLALNRGRDCTREMLGERLWPDIPADIQRSRLRVELNTLRTLLGQEFILSSGNTSLSLNASALSDVGEFEECAHKGLQQAEPLQRLDLLQQAGSLYRDGLLPQNYLPDSDEPQGDWLEQERKRLHLLHLDVLRRLLLDLEIMGLRDEASRVRRDAERLHPGQVLPGVQASGVNSETTGSTVGQQAHPKTFVGRENEAAHIREWLQQVGETWDENAILTVVGFGGVGKTRLVREALEGFSFLFVRLGNVRTTDELYAALQVALHTSPTHSATLRRHVLKELRFRGSLTLVLDGAEHLLRPVAEFWASASAECSRLRLLITSHRPLRLPHEKTLLVKALNSDDSLVLFLQRAEAVHPGFASTAAGKRAAAEIIQILEGSPLAIEIAAARALMLGPAQMREQLQNRLPFLVNVRPQNNQRHQSLRTVLEWSVSLLSHPSADALLKLGVFHGAFSLRAAAAVIGDDPPVVDALEALCLHALLDVGFAPDDEEAIYYLRGAVADFAREKNHALRREIARRHSLFYRQETERIAAALQKDNWAEASRRLLRDLPNYRAAVDTANRANETLRFLENLGLLYTEIGLWDDLARLLKPIEERLPTLPPDAQLARIVGWCGALWRRKGENKKAWDYWHLRLRIMQSLHDSVGIVNTLFEMTGQAIDESDALLAQSLIDQADGVIAVHRLTRFALNRLTLSARLHLLREEIEQARGAAFSGLVLLRDTRQREPLAVQSVVYASVYLTRALVDLGEDAEAEVVLHDAFPLCRDLKHTFALGVLLHAAGRLRSRQNRVQEAAVCFVIALSIHEDLESRYAPLWAADWVNFKRNHAGQSEVGTIAAQAAALSYPDILENFAKIIF